MTTFVLYATFDEEGQPHVTTCNGPPRAPFALCLATFVGHILDSSTRSCLRARH